MRRIRPRHLGVIGGARTIRSGVYRRSLEEIVPEITQRVAQPLSGMIERGEIGSQQMMSDLGLILRPMESTDALLMACTHYPAIAPLIQMHVPQARLIDPSTEMCDWISARWLSGEKRSARRAADRFCTTGDARGMMRAAATAFGVVVERARHVSLTE